MSRSFPTQFCHYFGSGNSLLFPVERSVPLRVYHRLHPCLTDVNACVKIRLSWNCRSTEQALRAVLKGFPEYSEVEGHGDPPVTREMKIQFSTSTTSSRSTNGSSRCSFRLLCNSWRAYWRVLSCTYVASLPTGDWQWQQELQDDTFRQIHYSETRMKSKERETNRQIRQRPKRSKRRDWMFLRPLHQLVLEGIPSIIKHIPAG